MGTTAICEKCNNKGYGRCVCENAPSSCTVDSIVRNADHITIGAFTIYRPENGRVKIDNANGEGGNFDAGLFEHTIRHAFQLYF